jgi:hypothetical protein
MPTPKISSFNESKMGINRSGDLEITYYTDDMTRVSVTVKNASDLLGRVANI